ncbi:hypothetical protein CHARACLAT_018136 [Characodon lateralis]|uniref:Uncharacterized protein n=1 Tax=Characodon lateralis TaxID=208331 RepID=A0ABU7EUW1_9TELE|nr:hypothetical protein [Characodon lateralis]
MEIFGHLFCSPSLSVQPSASSSVVERQFQVARGRTQKGLRSSCRLSPVIYSQEAGYTLARLPVHHNTGQTNMHTPTHT